MQKFKLITQIDRINYLSDNFINYYKRFFNPDEFRFMVHSYNQSGIKEYLYKNGFTNNEIETYDTRVFGWGNNIKKQNEIKKRYIDEGFTVVYADIDERIFHPNLREYILNNNDDWMIPTGVSLMQHPSEPPLDESKLVLEQRSYGKIDVYWFSKTCILRKDFEWLPGRHTKVAGVPIDPNFYLVDIGKMCKDYMLKNNEVSRKIYKKLFWRYSTNNKQSLTSVFNEHAGTLQLLPETIKKSLLF